MFKAHAEQEYDMKKFTRKSADELQNYIYALVDPATKEIFYVGRGIFNRAFNHFSAEGNGRKAVRIREIQNRWGCDPVVEVLRYGLTVGEAKLVEAAVIDALGPENLVNEVRGADVERGKISAIDFERKFGAKSVRISKIKEPLMLIFVNQTWNSEKSEVEIYDSIRQFWYNVAEEKREIGADGNLPYPTVLGLVESVVMRAYRVAAWFEEGATFSTRLNLKDLPCQGGRRFEFVGQLLPRHKLLGMRLVDDDDEPIRHNQVGYGYIN